MTLITEQDVLTINLLENFMTTINSTVSSYVKEIDRMKKMLFELKHDGTISSPNQYGFKVDTPANIEKTVETIWEVRTELENSLTAFYQLNCRLNLSTMCLIVANVLPKTFMKLNGFDLMLTKTLRSYKQDETEYSILPDFLGEVCKQLMSKLSFDEKEVKRKLIKIKEKLKEVMDEYTELEKINCLTNAEDDSNLKIVQKAEREISSFFQTFL